jgi:hypothetical protein
MEAGKKMREMISRAEQGEFTTAIDRIDPTSILEEQAKTGYRN